MEQINQLKEYVMNMKQHLFKDESLEHIIEGIQTSHRKRRFMMMYLLHDKDIFHRYYKERQAWGMERLFDQIIAGLLGRDIFGVKKVISEYLDISYIPENSNITQYEKREFTKDINSFVVYTRKNLS